MTQEARTLNGAESVRQALMKAFGPPSDALVYEGREAVNSVYIVGSKRGNESVGFALKPATGSIHAQMFAQSSENLVL
eukprot:12870554-Alexandrium_andersonii.AAC.1